MQLFGSWSCHDYWALHCNFITDLLKQEDLEPLPDAINFNVLWCLQVPYHIFATCAKVITLDRGLVTKEGRLTVFTAKLLLDQFTCIVNRKQGSAGDGNALSQSLSQSISQQLQHSGLMDALPVLLSAAATQLNMAAGMTDAQRQQRPGKGWDATKDKVPPRDLAEKLMDMTSWLDMLQMAMLQMAMPSWQPVATLPLRSEVSLLELALAVAHDVSRGLAPLGPTECPDPAELVALHKAFSHVQMMCGESLNKLLDSDTARRGSAPALDQVLLSAAVLPCLSLVLTYTMHCQTADEQRHRNAAAAARPSRAGSDSRSWLLNFIHLL